LDASACLRYVEEVTIRVDSITYAVYSGDAVNTAEVHIAGPVRTIEVLLSDRYDGDVQEGLMEVDISPVWSCVDRLPSPVVPLEQHAAKVVLVPNPASSVLTITLSDSESKISDIIIYSADGNPVLYPIVEMANNAEITIEKLPTSFYMICIQDQAGNIYAGKFIKL
jgi:hypothetical protein